MTSRGSVRGWSKHGLTSWQGHCRKGKTHANLSPECKCKDPNEILVNLEEHYITESRNYFKMQE